MSSKKLYITSTLPYANSSSGGHIGHLFEFVLTDALSRYFKNNLGKENVFFNTGIDAEGLKIWEKANELFIPVEDFLDKQLIIWKEFCVKFQIDYDNFYRTSDKEHQKKVQLFWNDCLKRDDIYKKPYNGIYCTGCESYKTEKDLINGKCPDHLTLDLKTINEENYFFKLSKYKNVLANWINENEKFLSPNNKLEELKNLINNIEDISVSRLKKNVPWGTEVPNDNEQIIYVWFSALLNYIFSCGYLEDEEKFNSWWENTIQLCGSDNLRFQAVIFQAILASAGIKQTGKLLVHGTILDADGNKMSKTTGNVIDPIDQLNKFGLTAVRYYALAGLSTYSNGSWSELELKELYNAHLANNYGNLIARTLHLIDIRNVDVSLHYTSKTNFTETIFSYVEEIKGLWNTFEIKNALQKTVELVNLGNKYFQENKPWEEQSTNYEEVLSHVYLLLENASILYYPVIPNMKNEIEKALSDKKKVVLFPRML